MKYFVKIIILLIVCWISFPSFSQTTYSVENVPNDHLINSSDYVTNPDGIISYNAEQAINAMIASVEEVATAEIAVVLLNSIGLDDIDDFGTRLFTQWGIGKNKKDNGLLFLLVYDQREMIFRTGYGLEGVLPDVILARVIRNDISPRLREGDFDAGVLAGISRVCDYLKDPEAVQEIIQRDNTAQERFSKTLRSGYIGISIFVFICFLLYYFFKLKSSDSNYLKYNSLNSKKGLVIAFTIIFPILMILFIIIYFVTIRYLRNKPLSCNNCGYEMHKLSESEEDAYLTDAQQKEESIGSRDYDVWLCDNCSNIEILKYDKRSKYMTCPHCHAKTYYLASDRTLVRATSSSKGKGERVYQCLNCKKKDIKPYIIPMIIVASSSSSSGGGGFSGGGGGGSWGGGRTGGGGARGGW